MVSRVVRGRKVMLSTATGSIEHTNREGQLQLLLPPASPRIIHPPHKTHPPPPPPPSLLCTISMSSQASRQERMSAPISEDEVKRLEAKYMVGDPNSAENKKKFREKQVPLPIRRPLLRSLKSRNEMPGSE
ncbi:hypothetical protein G7K_5458-t1 [Saitoella complicata NRRL Y-17804]|uniref:Uncharacterized protein n=1 Tax=Saitoella complicata (strain BCRC 22490 / CBS 7301 / JCM 7358 / NBRC 10748 / NRRL Y-17804) TaxID=698492 RepID=A0A0E9NNT6_SAICN|nr:hypothetical protein G7K_5458-t1 [Saitoella complicata NRRL Y-17804]